MISVIYQARICQCSGVMNSCDPTGLKFGPDSMAMESVLHNGTSNRKSVHYPHLLPCCPSLSIHQYHPQLQMAYIHPELVYEERPKLVEGNWLYDCEQAL